MEEEGGGDWKEDSTMREDQNEKEEKVCLLVVSLDDSHVMLEGDAAAGGKEGKKERCDSLN